MLMQWASGGKSARFKRMDVDTDSQNGHLIL